MLYSYALFETSADKEKKQKTERRRQTERERQM